MKQAGLSGSWWGLAATALAVVATNCAAATNENPTGDLVLRDGFIYTVDAGNSVQQAIAIQGGRIVYVGTDQGARAFVGKQTNVIDLHGMTILPCRSMTFVCLPVNARAP